MSNGELNLSKDGSLLEDDNETDRALQAVVLSSLNSLMRRGFLLAESSDCHKQ